MAVKTQVFERWDSGSGVTPEGELEGGDRARGYVRAIMETAISASVGHPNVVRAQTCSRAANSPTAALLR